MGYCLIDTVTEYENEAAVGRVIATNTTLVTKFFSPPNYGSNATLSASNGSQTSISERMISFMYPVHEIYEWNVYSDLGSEQISSFSKSLFLRVKVEKMDLTINGVPHQLEIEPETPLLWALRDDLAMTGTKYGCGLAQCGACTVLVNGQAVRSCVTPIERVAGASVLTIEAIEQDDLGKRVVSAWVKHQVPQCGYCQSGQVMAAVSLLKQVPHPTDDDINAAMLNLCRCGTYNAIRAAIHDLASSPENKGA